MPTDNLKILTKGLTWFLPYLLHATLARLRALVHRITYTPTPNPKSVVVIGGSFAGFQLVKRLTETLPTGYQVVWIEKNSHLNYSFTFPRFSVVEGFEREAFIPYDGVERGAVKGVLKRVQGVVTGVEKDQVQVILANGEEEEEEMVVIGYEYLVIATGSTQPLPVQVVSTEREEACDELRGVQRSIQESERIVVMGGGAVGVELASDIKDFYPGKSVTLVHSRGRLLNRFGERLGEYVLKVLQDGLGVRVLLDERPVMPGGGGMVRGATLVFSDGREEGFDLVIGCTGQCPNSSLLSTLYPDSISNENSCILVQPTLQIHTSDSPTPDPDQRVFAFGDVAAHSGPLMARAGFLQAEIVLSNILSLIRGRTPETIYKPNFFVEGAIKLTLGKSHSVIYASDERGDDAMLPSRGGKVDLDIGKAWRNFGVGGEFKKLKANEGLEGKDVKSHHV
ncbi:hypothetical protein BDW59DRAFT_157918 [Aspergillus cavernicola]|uniref:FAD/NAD(P)-binding domain-containing protein n=1 Tax=Aspergillus cavernicola TaxID=176166 RepID=A0ABR4IXF2_9EURO